MNPVFLFFVIEYIYMKKVFLCGLGAVGLTFGVKLNKCQNIDLQIIADKARLEKYSVHKPIFNGVEQEFSYVLPEFETEKSDLVIISTKSLGLDMAISSIKNFVKPQTRIISLINGISSEEKIRSVYPQAVVLKSYFIGHSAVRKGNSVTQDGVGEIVMEKDRIVEEIFTQASIQYSVPDDIDYSMWLKFTLNIFSNQTSAILKMDFGEMKRNKMFIEFAKKIIAEVKSIAECKNIKNLENLEKDCFNALSKMCDDGKTSMYQDILAKRQTEVDIFAGEIIRLGKLYGIATPYNQVLYDLIKIEEEKLG